MASDDVHDDVYFDEQDANRLTRYMMGLSERSSRRGFLAKTSRVVLGLAAGFGGITSFPIDRAFAHHTRPENQQSSDPTACNYWRYCNLHGTLCTGCSGGDLTTCPPGSEIGVEFWYGCCEHPDNGKTYMVSYRDCCGKSNCGPGCGHANMQETPFDSIMPSQDNDILWCQSTKSQTYTCTAAPIIKEGC